MKKISPFIQIKNYVENAIWDVALESRALFISGKPVTEYSVGYRTALADVLFHIYAIDRRRQGLIHDAMGLITRDDESFLEYVELLRAHIDKKGEG